MTTSESTMENTIGTFTQNGLSAQSDDLLDIGRRLEELDSEETTLKDQIGANRAKHRALTSRAIELKFGVRIGSVVRDKAGKLYLVSNISPSFTPKPWLRGKFKKNDGDWSIPERYLSDTWEIVA